jgi:hypothetical protein
MEGTKSSCSKRSPRSSWKYKYGVGVFQNASPVFPRRKAVGAERHASRVITAGFGDRGIYMDNLKEPYHSS